MMYSPDVVSTRSRMMLVSGLAACLLAVATAPHAARLEMCPPPCAIAVISVSVIGSPGIPDDARRLLEGLRFEGNAITPQSAADLQRLPGSLRAGTVLELSIAADAGLSGRAATTQINERINSLDEALQNAGVPRDQYTLSEP